MNALVKKFSVLNRVFCLFNQFCTPCRTRDVIFLFVMTPQAHNTRQCMIYNLPSWGKSALFDWLILLDQIQ